jgi:hypothetical protein
MFFLITYLRAPEFGPQFPEYPTSSSLVTSLVDGLILAHPPIFYTSLLFFFFLGPWGLAFRSAHGVGLRQRWVYYFRVIFFFLCGLALMSGGYWSFMQFAWGFWWTWDPIELVLFSLFFLACVLLHTRLGFFSYIWCWFTITIFVFLAFYSVFVRLGLVTSRHSFFSERALGLSFRSFLNPYIFNFVFCFLFLDLPFFFYLVRTAATRFDAYSAIKGVPVGWGPATAVVFALPVCCVLAYLSSFFFFEDLSAVSFRRYSAFEGLSWNWAIYFFFFLVFFYATLMLKYKLPHYLHILFFIITLWLFVCPSTNIKSSTLRWPPGSPSYHFTYKNNCMFNNQFFFYKFDNFRNSLSAILLFFFDKPSFFFVQYRSAAKVAKASSKDILTASAALSERLDSAVLLATKSRAPVTIYQAPIYLRKNNCLLLHRVTSDDSIYMDNIIPALGSNLKLITNDVSHSVVSRHLNIPLLRWKTCFLFNSAAIPVFFSFFLVAFFFILSV